MVPNKYEGRSRPLPEIRHNNPGLACWPIAIPEKLIKIKEAMNLIRFTGKFIVYKLT
jgi:hypothetical protein